MSGPSSAQWHNAAEALREHAVKFDRYGDMAREAEDAGRSDAERLAGVRSALAGLEAAYAAREHGWVAVGRCIDQIKAAVE